MFILSISLPYVVFLWCPLNETERQIVNENCQYTAFMFHLELVKNGVSI